MPILQSDVQELLRNALSLCDILTEQVNDMALLIQQTARGGLSIEEAATEAQRKLIDLPRAIALERYALEKVQLRYELVGKKNARDAQRKRVKRALARGEDIASERVLQAALEELSPVANPHGEPTPEEKLALAATKPGRKITREEMIEAERRAFSDADEGDLPDVVQPQPAAPGMADLPDLAGDEEDE